jgi:hypothetical protein
MSGLESDFDNVDCVDLEVKEIMKSDGLYFKKEDGTQGIIPRAKNENYWKFTEEEEFKSEKWGKEAIRDYPNADPTTIQFMINFYIKYPEEYRKILREKPKSKVDTFEEMRKKFEECDEKGNPVFGFDIDFDDLFIKN